MKFSEDSELAVKYLRQAIPTMMQHHIVPNPINYTLWYSYYSNVYPELNKQLEHTIERYQTCPVEVSESLFLQHIGQTNDEDQSQNEAYQRALSVMVNNLSDSINETSDQASGFSAALQLDIEALEKHELNDEISPLIDSLSANANAICDANDAFNNKLVDAQKEIRALKEELDKSREEANTDPLTGLSNRRVLESIYNNFVTEAGDESDLSIIIMDIDKFKVFNDTHGHLLGDQILKYVGSLLKDLCPNGIKPVRFGGEEFAIVCPTKSLDTSQNIAEKIRAKLESVPFTNKKTGDKIPPVTASFGVAKRKCQENLSSLIERADKALYLAKDNGRNQVQLAM